VNKIYPCLWFDTEAEEAAKFYTSIFKNSKIITTAYYPKASEEVSGKKEGSVMTVDFELEGLRYTALNGGPQFKFNESVSFVIDCEDQDEVDYYWDKLREGGDESAQVCGWLKDKYGVSWQIVPKQLYKLMSDPDKEKVERTMAAMLKMKKLDAKELQDAYDGK